MAAGRINKQQVVASQRTILVVDDEPLNMKLFTLALTRRGYRVLQAANGYHGFVIANDDHPDLIVMDVRLPNLSGLEVTRTLKENDQTKDIPIVVATAFLIDAEEIRQSKCDAYITKPFIISDFLALVNSLIERTRIGAEAR